MKSITSYRKLAAVCLLIILALYICFVTQSASAFGNGFATCLMLFAVYITIRLLMYAYKNRIVEINLDQEYIHIRYASKKIKHMKRNEIRKINIQFHDGKQINKRVKKADIVTFYTIFGERIPLVRGYNRSGKIIELYDIDGNGNKLPQFSFDDVLVLVNKENFPQVLITDNR